MRPVWGKHMRIDLSGATPVPADEEGADGALQIELPAPPAIPLPPIPSGPTLDDPRPEPPVPEPEPNYAGVWPCEVTKVYYDKADTNFWNEAGAKRLDGLDIRAIDARAVRPTVITESLVYGERHYFHGVLPDEMCPDQQAHHVAASDTVWVTHSPDGHDYFRTRYEPFFGAVVPNSETAYGSVHNDYVSVRQQQLQGNPGSDNYAGPLLSDMYATDEFTQGGFIFPRPGGAVVGSHYIDYHFVLPLRRLVDNSLQHHGLIKGDQVLVFQRGRYLFCMADKRSGEWCVITSEGLGSEADYEDNRYWVKRVNCNNDSGSVSVRSTWATGAAGAFTATNLAEQAGSTHDLPTGGETHVWVRPELDVQDPPVTHYVFSQKPSGDKLQWTTATTTPGSATGDNAFQGSTVGTLHVYEWADRSVEHRIEGTAGATGDRIGWLWDATGMIPGDGVARRVAVVHPHKAVVID